MNLSGLSDYLNLIISNQDVAVPKPNPEMFTKAIKIFSVQPQECLILEDNENGIIAAKESGAHLMKISTPEDVQLEMIEEKIKRIDQYSK